MAETCRNSQLFTKVHPYLFHDSPNYCPISSAFLRIHPPPSPSRSRSPVPSFSGTGIRSKIPGRCESQSAPRISRNSQLRCWRSTWRLPVVHRIGSTKQRGFYGIWRWCHYGLIWVFLSTFIAWSPRGTFGPVFWSDIFKGDRDRKFLELDNPCTAAAWRLVHNPT
jgi:hypothetical protein